MSINWQQYGLKNNPYDTAALIEGGDLPLDKAFVGRNNEIEFLDKAFSLEDNLNLTMCGNVGVGKTSLANYYKFLYKFGKNRNNYSHLGER